MILDIVSKLLRHLLVLIALFGVATQTFAYAQQTTGSVVSRVTGGRRVECVGMAMKPSAEKQAPCHGLTLDCIAKMGCIPASALADQPVPIARSIVWRTVVYTDGHSAAAGLTVEPEVFPPII